MDHFESKHRRLASRDVKRRFQHHQQARESAMTAQTAAVDGKKASPGDHMILETKQRHGGGVGKTSLSSPAPANNKRVMTMSQLRKAAIYARVSSPLKRLAIVTASPLALRIRDDLLKSSEKAAAPPLPPSSTKKEQALVDGTPVARSSSAMTPSSLTSRRRRLQETRFRRNSSSSSTRTTLDSTMTPTRFSRSHNTPLTRYAANFFSPPFTGSTVNRRGNEPSSSRKRTPSSLTRSTLPPKTPESIKSSSCSHLKTSRRLLSACSSSLPSSRMPSSPPSRAPLQSLFAASNRPSPRSEAARKTNRKDSPRRDASPIVMETEVVGSNRNIIRDCNDDASTSKTRRNLDKRSARLVHGRSFAAEIARLVSSNEYQSSGATSKSDTLSAEIGQAAMRGGSPINEGGKVTVAIRKRPLFPAEASRGDFNVVTMGEGACTVFKTALQADMKTAVIVPFTYPCTAALDEATTNPEVYRKVLQPHVVAAASAGNGSFPPPSMMLFTFGMTGSGKSHTMTGLERELVDDVPYPVSVQFLEVSGKVCRDLLAPEGTSAVASAADHAEVTGNRAWSPVRERSPIRILDQGDLSVLGATWVVTNTPDQLLDLLASAKTRRATHATDRNHESSRSHALVTLRLGSTGACLTLVDCAGTERSHDSLYHCKDRRAESAEINSSLYALKECIRARAAVAASASVPPLHKKPLLIPYRSSMLTRILRPHLESGGPLAVIATISPSATDTEHTLQTLDAVSMLLGTSGHVGSSHKLTQPRIRPESSDANHSLTVAPKKWTHEQLVNFLHRKHVLRSPRPADGSSASGSSIARSRLPAVVVPSTLDGRHAMRMNKIQLANTLGVPREVADRIFDLLRAETTRVARLELKQRVQAKNVSSLM